MTTLLFSDAGDKNLETTLDSSLVADSETIYEAHQMWLQIHPAVCNPVLVFPPTTKTLSSCSWTTAKLPSLSLELMAPFLAHLASFQISAQKTCLKAGHFSPKFSCGCPSPSQK